MRSGESLTSSTAERGSEDPDAGKYIEILDEKELLHTTVKQPKCVVHFYHQDFRRCGILHAHLTVRSGCWRCSRSSNSRKSILTLSS